MQAAAVVCEYTGVTELEPTAAPPPPPPPPP